MFTIGDYVKGFELNFSQHPQSKYCMMVVPGPSLTLLMEDYYESMSPKFKGKQSGEYQNWYNNH